MHKISEVIEPAFKTHLCHGNIRILKQPFCLPDAVFIDIRHGGAADCFFKQAAEILTV